MNIQETLLSVIRGRRSIRRYLEKPLPTEMLENLIEAASWAPSAGNRQDWFFTVVTSKETIGEMAKAVSQRWDEIIKANAGRGFIDEVARYAKSFSDFAGAPAVIVISSRKVDSVQEHMLGEDAGAVSGGAASAAMAAQNLMLAAHAAGLGTCCMTGPVAARERIGRIIGLPRRQEIVCMVAIGFPAENPSAPSRKQTPEIARFVV